MVLQLPRSESREGWFGSSSQHSHARPCFRQWWRCLLDPTLESNQFTPFELFLMNGDRRQSVGVHYGKDGALLRTASIREQRGNSSTDGWTEAIDQVEPWHPVGQWQGHWALRQVPRISRTCQPATRSGNGWPLENLINPITTFRIASSCVVQKASLRCSPFPFK